MDAKYGMYKRCENREEKTSVNKEIFLYKGNIMDYEIPTSRKKIYLLKNK